jgi:hypothetical protein
MALISGWTGLIGSYIAYGQCLFAWLTGVRERCGNFRVFESVLKFENLPPLGYQAKKILSLVQWLFVSFIVLMFPIKTKLLTWCRAVTQTASAIGAGVTSAVVSAGILVAGFLPYTT